MIASLVLLSCAAGASVLILRRPWRSELVLDYPVNLQAEPLREMLMRKSGIQIGELRVIGGQWHALTAYGWLSTSELLDLSVTLQEAAS